MSILVFNAGSSSLKFGLFDAAARDALASGVIDWADGDRNCARLDLDAGPAGRISRRVDVPRDRAAALCAAAAMAEIGAGGALSPITTVAHRVVHGGADFREHVLIDQRVKETLARLAELAPLHNPPALEAIRAAEDALPHAAQVAVFDTAFYARQPPRAHIYPVPYDWHERWGVRRFGFHGISHKYCDSRAIEMLASDPARHRVVVCHLGSGCSATAIRGGLPVATTMGFTPMEGLMMGTRAGSVDPGILIHLQRRCGLTMDQIDDALNHHSGLLGVSGVSPDYVKVEAAAREGNARAQLALEMFADRVRSTVGALAVAMGGVDVLIFTAGLGTNSSSMRSAACEGLECLGLRLDAARNAACRPDADIAAGDSSATDTRDPHARRVDDRAGGGPGGWEIVGWAAGAGRSLVASPTGNRQERSWWGSLRSTHPTTHHPAVSGGSWKCPATTPGTVMSSSSSSHRSA